MAFRQVTVSGTARQIVPYHSGRTSLVILNNGTGNIFISQDPQEIDTRGFLMLPGVTIGLSVADGDEPQLAVHAQSAGGSEDVRIVEQYVKEIEEA